ncbi:hypothetical protein ACTNEW_09135 [Blautia sp. HCP3S3_G3]|uniref:hypothetical protein n=1 Tax=Blautia sp. HCP3S3_G3 TaxID=3438913 RepID=UPI003F88E3E2
MTALYTVHQNIRGIVMMMLYFLSLIQIGCLIASFEGKTKYLVKYILPVFLLTFTELIFLRYVNKQIVVYGELPSEKRWNWLFQFPAEAAGLMVLIIGIFTFLSLYRILKYYRNSITVSSIKESIDNLPTGLSFSAPNGRILLANHRMEVLCHAVTGMDFQDAEQFWNILCSGCVCNDAERISEGNTPSIRLSDSTIWTFGKKMLTVEDHTVVQITAADTTDLYELSEELKENNRDLTEMNSRLRQYGENIDSFVRSREVLETKMRIHNEIGQALLASRSYLLHEAAPLQEKDILKRWNYIVALLKQESVPQDFRRTWNYFVNAANSAGVKILLEGELPDNEEIVKLIVAAAAEALTNAVRHAGADELSMKLYESENKLEVTFTNNGRRPAGEITVGGGLEALRLRLEEAGGSMKISARPHFVLNVTLPMTTGRVLS